MGKTKKPPRKTFKKAAATSTAKTTAKLKALESNWNTHYYAGSSTKKTPPMIIEETPKAPAPAAPKVYVPPDDLKGFTGTNEVKRAKLALLRELEGVRERPTRTAASDNKALHINNFVKPEDK